MGSVDPCGRDVDVAAAQERAMKRAILTEFGITASPSRLYNEVLDNHHHSEGLQTPRRRVVRLAPTVVIRRLDGKE